MSSIKSAVTKVKNFFSGIIGNPEDEENNPGPSRLTRGFLGGLNTRKRGAPNTFEPEITDDEDDYTGFTSTSPVIKRIRIQVDPDHPSMSSRYPTRGSGIPPGIEGAEKQPWEFRFLPKGQRGPKGTSSLITSDKLNPPSSSRSFSSSGPSSSKNIEVITLDDDGPSESKNPVTNAGAHVQPQPLSVSQGGNEIVVYKPPSTGSVRRDGNRVTRILSSVTQKIISRTSTAVRYGEAEKNKYKRLLMAYQIINNEGSYQTAPPLSRSRIAAPEIQAMYHKFGSSPSAGTVSFQRNGQSWSSRRPALLHTSGPSALVPIPRLFSTPQDDQTPSRSSSAMKAITYKGEPDVIDIAAEDDSLSALNVEKIISPITPVSSRKIHHDSSPVTPSGTTKFVNLQDALDRSVLPDMKNDEVGDDIFENSYEEKTTDDLSIIAERIVDKSKRKSVNTLELEQTSCPYVGTQWLNSTISTWRDNQKSREERIRAEAKTIEILKSQSTLDKDLDERLRKKLTLTEIIVLEEPKAEELPELTDEIMAIISNAKRRGNDGEALAKVVLLKDTISISRGDIKTLGPGQWLNDNVINTYFGLIVLRGKKGKFPSVYAFQTFFYPKLMKEGYSNSLKRWTRKDDIFAHDLIILPIHLGLHWCLACIDFRKNTIKYYDSLGGDNNKCLHLLMDYITREMKERKQKDLDRNEWKLENVKGIPQQQNGSDCGMFSCKFAEYLSRDADFTFTQDNMPYYRDRMIYELISSELLYP